MCTHRIFCCSAAIASQVAALLAFLVVVGQVTVYWINYEQDLALAIFQTVLLGPELAAAVLNFFACRSTRPALMLPTLNCSNLIAMFLYALIGMWGYADAGTYASLIGFYSVGFLIAVFVLHCHICCYHLLVFMRNKHDNGHENCAM